MDKGHRYTDKQIELLEKRLRSHYKKVSKEARDKLLQYLTQNEPYYTELWRRLDEGEITEAEFEYLIMTDNGLGAAEGDIVNSYVDGDGNAMGIIGAVLGGIYVYNSLYQGRKIQNDIGKVPGFMKRIKDRKKTPSALRPDRAKDRVWHRTKIGLVVQEGMKRGRSIYDIAENLERVTNMDLRAAIRAARTACTNAENQAKLDVMYTLRDEYGVYVRKMWYATLDNRTRTSHRELHGETRELEEPFSNGLQFPGDMNGDPGEVWNCRCTIIDVISGMDDIKESPDGMSREEWIKKKPVSKPYPVPKGR